MKKAQGDPMPRTQRSLTWHSFLSWQRLLATFFLVAAALLLATSLSAIANFAWRVPMFDQWRLYDHFLSLPFPENILQLENGHRPIIPNLIRVMEIHWFAADQLLQIGIGTTCAFVACAVPSLNFWRARELPLAARAAGVLLAVTGIFWLANARMLMHGSESLHAYLVIVNVVLACLLTWQASRDHSLQRLALACLACTVATFSFGPGIAGFVSVVALGLLLRLPWRWLLLPAGTLVGCLLLYTFALPGEHSVRNALELHPLASLSISAQWLSSPWVNAWLGFADPQLKLPDITHWWPGSILHATAFGLVKVTGSSVPTLSSLLGFAGILYVIVRFAIYYARREQVSSAYALALGICLFALSTSAIVGLTRLDYLMANPGQIYSDRYLLWPCLFWSGLAMIVLMDACRSGHQFLVGLALTGCACLPVMLYPSHHAWVGWSDSVYRISQQSAASARSGLFDGKAFPSPPGVSNQQIFRVLALMKQNNLAMFADPGWKLVDTTWPRAPEVDPHFRANAQIDYLFHSLNPPEAAAEFSGQISHGMESVKDTDELAIVTADDRIVGLAEFSGLGGGESPLRLDVPRKTRFDGYIRDYNPATAYRLVLLKPGTRRAIVLHTINPAVGTSTSNPQ